jgi:hypothetical protein
MSVLLSPKSLVASAAAMAARVIPDQCPSDLLMRLANPQSSLHVENFRSVHVIMCMNDNLSFRDPHKRIGSRLMAPKHLCLFRKIQNHLVIRPAQGSERNAMPRPCEWPSPSCMTVTFMFSYRRRCSGNTPAIMRWLGKHFELEYSYYCHPLAAIDASYSGFNWLESRTQRCAKLEIVS